MFIEAQDILPTIFWDPLSPVYLIFMAKMSDFVGLFIVAMLVPV